MTKKTFLEFLKDQNKKHYSAELILKHLKNGWEEIDDVVEIPIRGILNSETKKIDWNICGKIKVGYKT